MENSFENEKVVEKYRKRVKAMAGFYKHLAAYVLVNLFMFAMKIINMDADDTFFEWGTFITAISWGIGLAAHYISVFKPSIVVGKGWEERKIKEFMERERNKKSQWE